MRMKKTVFVLKKPSIREIIHFAETARSFTSHIMVCHDKMTANGKGLLGLVSFFFEVEQGGEVVLTAAGPDAAKALEKLGGYFSSDPSTDKILLKDGGRWIT